MNRAAFQTGNGHPVTAVTAAEMRGVDRIAVEDVGLPLFSMMENAGRNLARVVRERTDEDEPVTILAGDGGNGGGGLACARHLANHGRDVAVTLDRPAQELSGVTATQYGVLDAMDVPVTIAPDELQSDGIIVDALVGYGLDGPLGGTAGDLVGRISAESTVISLDVPTGRNATTGEQPGVAVDTDLVVTLALPKTGLQGLDCSLLLADIGIPAVVYDRLDLIYDGPFDSEYVRELIDTE
ncbi:NAD(P)H-hydrate epimerase [Halorhabdus rudnickae]|uniref:NAD(P)H-hydrate epimerase n=1 Tax=Halorhabdus rudnickae TaxID=1775544 RepID=UPI001FCE835B|nr:NAD(P)H-hydrate epimerase [Halorhabdus rudnickae]